MDAGVTKAGVLSLEICLHLLFPAKALHHRKPGDALFHLAIEGAQGLLLGREQLPGSLCDGFGQAKIKTMPTMETVVSRGLRQSIIIRMPAMVNR